MYHREVPQIKLIWIFLIEHKYQGGWNDLHPHFLKELKYGHYLVLQNELFAQISSFKHIPKYSILQ